MIARERATEAREAATQAASDLVDIKRRIAETEQAQIDTDERYTTACKLAVKGDTDADTERIELANARLSLQADLDGLRLVLVDGEREVKETAAAADELEKQAAYADAISIAAHQQTAVRGIEEAAANLAAAIRGCESFCGDLDSALLAAGHRGPFRRIVTRDHVLRVAATALARCGVTFGDLEPRTDADPLQLLANAQREAGIDLDQVGELLFEAEQEDEPEVIEHDSPAVQLPG